MKTRLYSFVFLAIVAAFDSSRSIQIVQSGRLGNCSSPTLGQAVDRVFSSLDWTASKASGELAGSVLVYANGTLQFKGQETDAQLQFVVNEQTGSFDVVALRLNGVSQSNEIMTAFFAKACE